MKNLILQNLQKCYDYVNTMGSQDLVKSPREWRGLDAYTSLAS